MEQAKLPTLLMLITPKVIEMLKDERKLSYQDASTALYNSKLYSALEDVETGVWKLSPLMLYGLLKEELETGKITFPEEQ